MAMRWMGFDESCAHGYERGGILDDEINEKIVRPLTPRGVQRFTLLMDVCAVCSSHQPDNLNGDAFGEFVMLTPDAAVEDTVSAKIILSVSHAEARRLKMTYGRLLMSLRKLIDCKRRGGIFQDGRAAFRIVQTQHIEILPDILWSRHSMGTAAQPKEKAKPNVEQKTTYEEPPPHSRKQSFSEPATVAPPPASQPRPPIGSAHPSRSGAAARHPRKI
nr:hypothetical protein Iba_chr04cCG2730 [Ipomoea batatas]